MSPYIACFLLNNHPSLILCLASSLSSSASFEQASEITDPVAMKNSNPICSHYTFFLSSLLSWHSGASFLQIYCSSSCTEDTPWSRHSDSRNLNFLKVTLKACIPSLFLSNTSSIFVQRRYLLWELKIFAAQLSSGVDLNCLNPSKVLLLYDSGNYCPSSAMLFAFLHPFFICTSWRQGR